MEEIKNKLFFSDPTIRCRCMMKLMEAIIQKKPSGQPISSSTSIQIPELSLLWECCGNECSTVGNLVSQGLISLVSGGHIDMDYAINMFLSIMTSARNLSPPIYGLIQLLSEQMSKYVNRTPNIKCPYSLKSPKHPLISVLQKRSDSWPLILESALQVLLDENKKDYGFQMMEPVLQYVFENPEDTKELSLMRNLMSEKIPRVAKYNPTSQLIDFLYSIIPWLQVSNLLHVVEAANFVLNIKEIAINSQNEARLESLIYITLALCHSSLQLGFDPTGLLLAAEDISCSLSKQEETSAIINGCLYYISFLISKISGSMTQGLLSISNILLEKRPILPAVSAMIIFPVLQLLAEPKLLTFDETEKTALNLTKYLKKIENCFNKFPREAIKKEYDANIQHEIKYIEGFSSIAGLSLHCINYACKLESSETKIKISWLNNVKALCSSGAHVTDFIYHIITSFLVMAGDDYELLKTSLEALETIVTKNNEMSTKLMPLLLYQLGREPNPESQLLILEYLPRTATHKYSIPPVLNVLQIAANHPGLKAQAIYSLVLLWKKQERCFPYVHKLLVEKNKTISVDTGVCEVLIAQAAAIKEICLKVPHKHGGELLGVLSSILNESNDDASSPGAALALEGVYILCKSEVIDLRTAWKALAPKLSKDKRPLVATRMYQLLSLAPELYVCSIEYDKFMTELTSYLWKHVGMENNSPITIGAAYKALAKFPVDYHTLKLLPAVARENLKLPSSMTATPFEMGRLPEDVLSYIPGYCYTDLLKSMDNEDILQGYGQFLESLIRQEIKDLPRSIYQQSKRTGNRQSVDKVLTDVPAVLCSQFEAYRQPAIQSSLAVGVLLSYEPPLELAKDGQPLKRSLVAQCQFYEQVLSVLIQEVSLDINEWQRCVLLPSAWGTFMERAYFSCEEGHRLDLEMQRSHGHLKGTAEEVTAMMDTSWLWNKPTSQANAIFAVAGLVRAVEKFSSSLEERAKKASEESEFLSHKTFQIQCTETILCAMNSHHRPSSKVFSWLLSHLSKATSSSGSLIRGCAAASLYHLIRILTGAFIDHTPHLCDILIQNINSSTSLALTLYSGIGLGFLVRALCQEGYVDSGPDQVNVILKTAEKIESVCDEDIDPKVGPLLGLTLIVSAVGQNGNPKFQQWISRVCDKYYDKLMEADSSLVTYEALSVCVTCMMVSAAAGSSISMQKIEDLMLWLDEKRLESPQCGGTTLSLGIVVDGLQRLGHIKGSEMRQCLLKVWLQFLASEKRPTLYRLAALKGICAMFSGGAGLLQINSELAVDNIFSGLNELIQIMFQLLKASRDTSLQNGCAWLLGELFAVHTGQQQASITVPSSFSYLPETSVLKPLADFAFTTLNEGKAMKRSHLLLSLKAIGQNFPRSLPPLNWVAILTPFLQMSHDTELMELCLKIGLYQMSGSPNAVALIASYATPPIVYNLPINCRLMLLSNLPKLATSLPPAKLQVFLKSVVVSIATDMDNFETEGIVAVQALSEALELPKCSQGVSALLHQSVIEIVNRLKANSILIRKHLDLIAKCLVHLPNESQNIVVSVSDDTEHLCSLTLLWCHLVKGGKKALSSLKPFVETGKHAPDCAKQEFVAILFECFLTGATNPESEISKPEKCIAWLMETIGWINVLTDTKSKYQLVNSSEVVAFLLDVCLAVIVSCSGFEVCYTFWPHSVVTHSSLVESLPYAIPILLAKQKWKEATNKIIDWLIMLQGSSHVKEIDKYYIQASFCALRSWSEFGNSSVWTEILSRQ